MRLRLRAGIEGSLGVRLVWLTALRLAVLTIFLIVTSTVYLGPVSVGGFSTMVAGLTVAVAYALAAIYAGLLRVGRALPTVALVQLVTDQAIWTVLVYITGGIESGAISLYGLTCLSGAILLGIRGALVAMGTGMTAYLGLSAGLSLGYLQPPLDQPLGIYVTTWDAAIFPVLVNVLAMFVVTALASYLAERLRIAGGRLEVATERAEKAERLAALGQLAAGLAHEIRNPLGSIRGSIELLHSSESLTDEERGLCKLIDRETARLNELVSDMLDLAKPRPPQRESVDMAGLLQELVTLVRASGRGGEVIVRFAASDRPTVFADPAQVRQLVWNLLRNAIQASSAEDEVSVSLRYTPSGDVRLEVRDWGAGISEEARARLFDAFFTTRSHGTGVGLAVVKQIVDSHGFTIAVESTEGKGTSFAVMIPQRYCGEAVEGKGELDEAAESPSDRPVGSLAEPVSSGSESL